MNQKIDINLSDLDQKIIEIKNQKKGLFFLKVGAIFAN